MGLAQALDHLWQCTLLAALTAFACRAFRHEAARVRHALWLAASLKFLVPFPLLTALGRSFAPDEAGTVMLETVSTAVAKAAGPFGTTASAPTALVWALIVVWGAGALTVLTRWLIEATRLHAIVRDAELDPLVRFAGRRCVRVRYSSAIMEPGVIGFLSPVLLLPKDIGRVLTAEQLESVIAHELCHVRRHDNAAGALHMLVEMLFWFYPPVWWIGARLVEERERACDEAVVREGHDRKVYSRAILDVCEHYIASPLRCAAGVGGGSLAKRVTHVMRSPIMNRMRPVNKTVLALAAAVVLTVPVLSGVFAQNTDDAELPEVWLPVAREAPVYPARAAVRGLEGCVVLEYTVTQYGTVEDVRVLRSSSALFERSAVDAVSKYEYEPKRVNGEPVDVAGVRSMITFVLETEADRDASSGCSDDDEMTV